MKEDEDETSNSPYKNTTGKPTCLLLFGEISSGKNTLHRSWCLEMGYTFKKYEGAQLTKAYNYDHKDPKTPSMTIIDTIGWSPEIDMSVLHDKCKSEGTLQDIIALMKSPFKCEYIQDFSILDHNFPLLICITLNGNLFDRRNVQGETFGKKQRNLKMHIELFRKIRYQRGDGCLIVAITHCENLSISEDEIIHELQLDKDHVFFFHTDIELLNNNNTVRYQGEEIRNFHYSIYQRTNLKEQSIFVHCNGRVGKIESITLEDKNVDGYIMRVTDKELESIIPYSEHHYQCFEVISRIDFKQRIQLYITNRPELCKARILYSLFGSKCQYSFKLDDPDRPINLNIIRKNTENEPNSILKIIGGSIAGGILLLGAFFFKKKIS